MPLGQVPAWIDDATRYLGFAAVTSTVAGGTITFVSRRARRKVVEVMKPELEAIKKLIVDGHIAIDDRLKGHIDAQVEQWRINGEQHAAVVSRLEGVDRRLTDVESYIETRIDLGRNL